MNIPLFPPPPVDREVLHVPVSLLHRPFNNTADAALCFPALNTPSSMSCLWPASNLFFGFPTFKPSAARLGVGAMSFYTEVNRMMIVPAAGSGQDSFLPEGQLRRLVKNRRFAEFLGLNAPQALINFVHDEAPRVFLAIWSTFEEPGVSDLLPIMERLQKCRFTDDMLPFDITDYKSKCRVRGTAKQCYHPEPLDAFHDTVWNERKLKNFCTEQWGFIVPVFKKGDAKRSLPAPSRLPFFHLTDAGRGAFSDVFKAGLHVDHQKYFGFELPPGAIVVPVAVKKFRNDPEAKVNARNAWEEEATTVDKLGSISHKHLIQRMAAFSRGQEYYIMFEWADGGNLEQLWLREPTAKDHKLTGDRIITVLEQLYGLTDALCRLHGTNTRTHTGLIQQAGARARTLAPPVRSGIPAIEVDGLDASESPPATENWRHGDLKPQNILKVGNSTWLGTLKIADLGLAKQHQLFTHLRDNPTNTKFTTQHYEAPEVIISSNVPRSRRYDIWSMGCIIFEFVVWLLYGRDTLLAFYKEADRFKDHSLETLYFVADRRGGTARVGDVFSHWMNHILDNDPECNKAIPTVLGDLLRLLKTRLLVVDLPGPGRTQGRCDSSKLREELGNILENARHSLEKRTSYILADPIRARILPPRPFGSRETARSGTHLLPNEGLPLEHRPVPLRSRAPSPAPLLNPRNLMGECVLQNVRFVSPNSFLKPMLTRGNVIDPQTLNDVWEFVEDNAFAGQIFNRHLQLEGNHAGSSSVTPEHASILCNRCQRLDFWVVGFAIRDTLSALEANWNICELCRLLHDSWRRFGTTDSVEFRRIGSVLAIQGSEAPALSIYRTTLNGIQIPLPD
ncbi:Putative protein kinase [Colletotrichum destructivum]|uniref:Protein kinase domain-containing protein n=1 Tax=Colletotrichum destructivum TaxID=34406 RepID=A0AAX4IWS7_9PEZI|nr:Putative protein kinase [Colletotrichum destructivum]